MPKISGLHPPLPFCSPEQNEKKLMVYDNTFWLSRISCSSSCCSSLCNRLATQPYHNNLEVLPCPYHPLLRLQSISIQIEALSHLKKNPQLLKMVSVF